MNLREAAQQALEALEDSHQNINPERRYADELTRQIADAITALRAALSEDVPETNFGNITQTVDSKESDHVADTGKTSDQSEDARGMVATSLEFRQVEPVAYCTLEQLTYLKLTVPSEDKIAIYTSTPKREPLTDEEISKIFIYCGRDKETFARAIEQAHGIGE